MERLGVPCHGFYPQRSSHCELGVEGSPSPRPPTGGSPPMGMNLLNGLQLTSGRLFNFIIGMSSPDAFAGIGGYYYVIILCFCLFSAWMVIFFYVETANHTLEEIAIAFGDRAFLTNDEAVLQEAHLQKDTEKEPLSV